MIIPVYNVHYPSKEAINYSDRRKDNNGKVPVKRKF